MAAQIKQAFQSGDYETALELLNQAISADASNYKLYDSRSAVYLKQGSIKSAMQDARKQIALDGTAEQGYKRAAEAYCAVKKYDAAVKVLEAGIKAVEAAGKSAARLHRLLEETTFLLHKPVNPVSTLPKELFLNTIHLLLPDDRLRASHVCKAWRQAIHQEPSLWDYLRLHNDHKPLAKCKFYVDKLQGQSLKALILSLSTKYFEVVAKWLETCVFDLIALRIQDFSLDTADRQYCWVRLQCQHARIISLAGTYSLDWKQVREGFPNASALELHTNSAIFEKSLRDYDIMKQIFGSSSSSLPISKPQHFVFREDGLEIDDMKSLKSLEHMSFHVGTGQLNPIFMVPNVLERLVLFGTTLRTFASESHDLADASIDFSCLRTLVLERVHTDVLDLIMSRSKFRDLKRLVIDRPKRSPTANTQVSFWNSLPSFDQLEDLELTSISFDDRTSLRSICAKVPCLRRLDLSRTLVEDDGVFKTLADCAPLLEELDISHNDGIRTSPVVQLVKKGWNEETQSVRMKRLDLMYCSRMEQAGLDWLRKYVPTVNHRYMDPGEVKRSTKRILV